MQRLLARGLALRTAQFIASVIVASLLLTLLPPGPDAYAADPPTYVTLTSSSPTAVAGTSLSLTASTNTSLSSSHGLRTYIIKEDTGQILHSCASTNCSTIVTYDSFPGSFFAVLATHTASITHYNQITGIIHQTGAISITRAPWTVTLTTDKTVVSAGERASMHIALNQSISGSSGTVAAGIFNVSSGALLDSCTLGTTSCTYSVPLLTGPHIQIKAAVYDRALNGANLADIPTAQIYAESNIVPLSRKPWEISLSGDTHFEPRERIDFHVIANQNIGHNNSPYKVHILDVTIPDPGQPDTRGHVSRCSLGYECHPDTGSWVTSQPRQYQAFVDSAYAPNSPDEFEDLQASSNIITVLPLDWDVSLAYDEVTRKFTATPNREMDLYSGGLVYDLYIFDKTANERITYCSNNTISCTTSTIPAFRENHEFIAVIARREGIWAAETMDQIYDIRAESETIIPAIGTTTASPDETAGGQNPSQFCSQSCIGDPVNSVTGEYYESNVDITVPSAGIPLSFTRSYGTSFSSTNSDLGYGWNHSYGMKMESESPTGVLTSESRVIAIHQENGSVVRFYRNDDGAYAAADRTLATLTWNSADELFEFTRTRTPYTYAFSEEGQLQSITDRMQNVATLSYASNGLLESVVNNHSAELEFTYDAQERITEITSSAGQEVEFAYSSSGNLIEATNAKEQSQEYTYDSSHRILTFSNSLDGITTNTYDAQGRVIEQVDPEGGELFFTYNADHTIFTDALGIQHKYLIEGGKTVAITEAFGTPDAATTAFSYDSTGQIATRTNPLGYTTTYAYDDHGNLVSEISPEGRATSYTYNDLHQVLTTTTTAGTQVRTYDAQGLLTSITSALGAEQTFTYNTDGTLASTTSARGNEDGANPADFTTTYSYNSSGIRTSTTHPNGDIDRVEVNALGLETVIFDPRDPFLLNAATQNQYSPAGFLEETETAEGGTTAFTHDAMGNILTATDPEDGVAAVAYDLTGKILTETNPLGGVTEYTLDANGQVIAAEGPNGGVMTFAYDERGNAVSEKDAEGNETLYAYDLADQVVSMTDVNGVVTTFTYDKDGNQLSQTTGATTVSSTYGDTGLLATETDADGNTTSYTYDADGRLISVINADTTSRTMTYDTEGHLLTLVDEEFRTQSWTYDSKGRRISYSDPAGAVTSFTFDAADNELTATRADGSVVSAVYDGDSRPVTITHSDGVDSLTRTSVFDDAGRIVQISQNGSTVTYDYDALGNQVSALHGASDLIQHSYTNDGALASITYPSGEVVEYQRDLNGSVVSIDADSLPSPIAIARTELGQLENLVYPNGIQSDFSYSALGLLDSVIGPHSSTSTLAYEFVYTHSAGGNVLSEVVDGGTPEIYEYDERNRLIDVNTGSYTYSDSGHLTGLTSGTTIAVNPWGAPTAVTLGTDESSYTYDLLGNRTQRDVEDNSVLLDSTSYDWNLDGSLGAAGSVAYGYGADGLLRSRSDSTTSADNSFIWDTSIEVPLLLADDTHDFIYAEGTAPIAQIERATGAVEYLHADAMGSVIAKTDSLGAVLATTSFDPYGQGAPIALFGFTGAVTDEDTGLVYLRNRWYDPEVGSFLSVDPLLEMTSQAFAYANGNPLSFTDPLGLFSIGDWWGEKSTADKLSLGAMAVGAAALAVVLLPITVPVAVGVGLAGAGTLLSGAAAGLYWQDGDHTNAVLSGIGAFTGGAAFATGILRGSVALQNGLRALTKKPTISRNPAGNQPYFDRVDSTTQAVDSWMFATTSLVALGCTLKTAIR